MANETVLSSKGQIVIAQELREELGWEKGDKIKLQETPQGVLLVKVPKNPLMALKGILKNVDISSKDVIKARRQDFSYG